LEAKTPAGSCKITLNTEKKELGLLTTELTLTGFDKEQAWVDFQSYDKVSTGGNAQDHNHLGYKINDSVSWVREKSLLEKTEQTGSVDWIVWGDKYFAAILIPEGTFNPNVSYGPRPGATEKDIQTYFGARYPLVSKSGEFSTYKMTIYFGLRDSKLMESVNPKIMDAVDLGFFASVSKVLIWALNKLNSVFSNYGLSSIFVGFEDESSSATN
jgi:YidC/Oxa1 family membrane protein insertase